jgi:hypothetical protein
MVATLSWRLWWISLLQVIMVESARPGSNAGAFQFMSNWKMPTYDPLEEETNAKFGDKSRFRHDKEMFLFLMFVFSQSQLVYFHLFLVSCIYEKN